MDVISNIVDTSKAYKVQETPYFKRLRLREESDLVHIREATQIIENAADKFLEPQIRRIRLNKLCDQIEQQNNERRQSAVHQKRVVPISTPNIAHDRILQAKQKGNEYSQRNRRPISIAKLYATQKALRNKNDIQNTSFIKRKEYGQHVKQYNKQNSDNQRPRQVSEKPECKNRQPNERNRKNEYGQYYSLKNRLGFKHSIKEFDEEYDDLLLQCELFEKDHRDVCSFGQEQECRSRNKATSKVTNSSQSSRTTMSSFRSDSDLKSLCSTARRNGSRTSTVFHRCSWKSSTASQTSSQSSKEMFDTNTKILQPETKKSADKFLDVVDNTPEKINNCKRRNARGSKHSNLTKQGKLKSSSSDDIGVRKLDPDNQEVELSVQKYASAITKSSSTSDEFCSRITRKLTAESKAKKGLKIYPSKEISSTRFNISSSTSSSTEKLEPKFNKIKNFDEILKNIICHKQGGRDAGKENFSLVNELSNLFIAYGRKLLREAPNGTIDQNLIEAFALKQQTSVREAFKNIQSSKF